MLHPRYAQSARISVAPAGVEPAGVFTNSLFQTRDCQSVFPRPPFVGESLVEDGVPGHCFPEGRRRQIRLLGTVLRLISTIVRGTPPVGIKPTVELTRRHRFSNSSPSSTLSRIERSTNSELLTATDRIGQDFLVREFQDTPCRNAARQTGH